MTTEQPQLIPDLLPDIPGLVHGIKGCDPYVIQCDDCGLVLTKGDREPLVIFLYRICFNPRDDDDRRLCADCWREAGWGHTASQGWRQV